MKTVSILGVLALLTGTSLAQGTLSGVNGDCAIGGQQVITQGLPSTATQPIGTTTVSAKSGVIASYPKCTVTVYLTGTVTTPPIYQDNLVSPTPLSNPFTANTDGSYTFFVAQSCPGYDIVLSSGTGPAMPTVRTLTDVCTGGGTGANPLLLQVNETNNGSQAVLDLHAGTNITLTDNGVGRVTIAASGGGGGGNPQLDNCTPDQTGNSFYSVLPLTNYFNAHWELVFNTTTYFNCQVFIPTAQTGATLVLDIAANDGTAGHTASFQTCDGVINSGTINTGSLTCAGAQTFTTTSTAYNRVTLTFNVQSTLSNNSILVVKIGVSPTGTAPTANLIVYPHFIL